MKNIFKSKTLWFNIISAIIFFLSKEHAIELEPNHVTAGVLGGNALLRLVTHQGLTIDADEPTK